MADKADSDSVVLISPNGTQVSVATAKQDARLSGGYRLPDSKSAQKKQAATKSEKG